MTHPYKNIPTKGFWRPSVSTVSPLELSEVYEPRFAIDENTKIAAAGSCFAQHIGREFKERGYKFLDVEAAPPLLPSAQHSEFGFGMYSARYGNVYTPRQLLQLFQRANGTFTPQEPWWVKDNRYYDPFRPNIQKNGYSSEDEAIKDRNFHLQVTETLCKNADIFIFTFGLTEAWLCTSDGAVLPTCPGTIAGQFSSEQYEFHNFSYPEVLSDIEEFIHLARCYNPKMKFLFTVSPVPLTATASGNHVLVASTYSKSVLRAVCGALVDKYQFVDYFPSYELVSSHPMRGMFYSHNLREVSMAGVNHVMNTFFKEHPSIEKTVTTKQQKSVDNENVVCEEAILEEFGS